MNRTDMITCPHCRTAMPETAWFCPGCSRPRSWLREHLREEALRTGTPYLVLLDQARADHAPATPESRQFEALRGEVHALAERVGTLEALAGVSVAVAVPPAEAPVEAPLAVAEVTPAEAPPIVERPPEAPAFPLPLPSLPWIERETLAAAEPAVPPATAVGHGAVAAEEEPFEERWEPPAAVPRMWARPDLEQILSGRVLAWTGGLALLLGGIFFLSLAFSRGWIGPSARVTIGIVAGALMVAGGGWFFERRERLFGHVLLAVGLGVLDMSFLAGTRLYDLFPIELGLAGTLVSAVAAAVIAIWADSQVVAGYGLSAALIAPPLLGAEPNGATIAYVSALLIGTTGIALHRYWRWLPPLAFALSAPQLADWVSSNPTLAPALVAVAGFWVLHAIAAGGEEFRVRRDVLRSTSATLLLANAAFVVWAGFRLLDGDLEGWRGTFLAAVALAHMALSAYFLLEEGDEHPFGLLAFGTGLAALSIAVPVQFGGPVVPIAWAAEAAALAWVYTRLDNRYSAGAALLLAAGAVGHLVAFEYPLSDLADDLDNRYPFMNAEGLTLAFLLAAAAVAGWFVRGRLARVLLACAGLLLVIYALPFETTGVALVGAWAGVYALAVALLRVPAFQLRRVARGQPLPIVIPFLGRELIVPAAVAAMLAVAHTLNIELPMDRSGSAVQPDVPFIDGETLTAAFLVAATLIGGYVSGSARYLRWSGLAAVAAVAYLMPFELEAGWTVVAWSILAAGLFALPILDRAGLELDTGAAGALAGVGALMVLDRIAMVEQLTGGLPQPEHTPFWSEATLAIGSLIAALLAGFWLHRARRYASFLVIAALGFATYLMPFELGDATVVVAWATLVLMAGGVASWRKGEAEMYLGVAGAILSIGLLKTLIVVAPPERLAVDAASTVDHPLLWSGATLALASLIVPLVAGYWRYRAELRVRGMAITAGALVVYLLSVGLVDEVQRRVGGATALEELQKQAQTGLSILWAGIGGAVFVVGITRRVTAERLFALALLGLATAKVFVIDLASLDAAYRVLSFIGLGILLLASSWAYQHWMPQIGRGDDIETTDRSRGPRFRGPRAGAAP